MTFYVGPAERRCVLRAAMVGCVLLSSTPSASAFAASPDEQRDPPRVGTTGILNAGVGWQDNSFIDDSGAGPYFSIGIGGFIQPKWALMLRGSINIATLTRGPGDDFSSEGGFAGISGQWWINDRATLEGGMGLGYIRTGETRTRDESFENVADFDGGFALLLAAGYSLFHGTKHSLRAGLEYTPIFVEGSHHILSFVIGYQRL